MVLVACWQLHTHKVDARERSLAIVLTALRLESSRYMVALLIHLCRYRTVSKLMHLHFYHGLLDDPDGTQWHNN
jgi:hypothetical protein